MKFFKTKKYVIMKVQFDAPTNQVQSINLSIRRIWYNMTNTSASIFVWGHKFQKYFEKYSESILKITSVIWFQ